MNKLLIIVDMQNDFIDGALANPAAQAVVPNLVNFVNSWEGPIWVTLDTHTEEYLSSQEGKLLPIQHCIIGTPGHQLNSDLEVAVKDKLDYVIMKQTFGFADWRQLDLDTHFEEVTLVGTCTDICVISNVLAIKAAYPELKVNVIENLCAGLSPEKHAAAIEVMKSCQVNII